MKHYDICMSVAGSDPSGGAGLQADLKTFTLLRCYGEAVPTALTVQNTLGVRRSIPVDAALVYEQMAATFSDLAPQSVKIGIVPTAAVAQAIARALREFRPPFVVLDPVLVSSSGHRLADEAGTSAIVNTLMPLCSLITPNLPEARFLTGDNEGTSEVMARKLLLVTGCGAVLVKGGHSEGEPVDTLCEGKHIHTFSAPRVATRNSHGTGCVLSSAIAAFVARGHSLPDSVGQAKKFLTQALRKGAEYSVGQGTGGMYLIGEN